MGIWIEGGWMNFFNLSQELLSVSPFKDVRPSVLVPGQAVEFSCGLEMFPEHPVRVNWDHGPDGNSDAAFIRIGTQGGGGCSMGCSSFCEAGGLVGKKLSKTEIVFQVLHVLLSTYVDLRVLRTLVVATFGLGEPLASPELDAAILELHKLLPSVRFIVSTTGPSYGGGMLYKIFSLVEAGVQIDFQFSIHDPVQSTRF